MSEHERGDRVLLRARVDGSGPSGSVVIVADHGTVHHVDPADLIPDDRHRTPIAPQDVREGDVVRLEWEDRPVAIEGPVLAEDTGRLYIGAGLGSYVDHPGRTLYLLSRKPTERDKWWPPQPGDTISDGVGRVTRGYHGTWWPNPDHPDHPHRSRRLGRCWTDADVPDDAVLLLPAQTREATS